MYIKKVIPNKKGIEVSRIDFIGDKKRIIAAHFYEKTEIDQEIKDYLNGKEN